MRDSIAVIDDSPTICKLIDVVLSQEGFIVTSYTNGIEALNTFAREQPECIPDLIFLDIQMPQMDGYDVMKRLKTCPKLARSIIVMISSYDKVTDRIKAYLLGAQDYLTKPFTPSDILRVIAQHLKPA